MQKHCIGALLLLTAYAMYGCPSYSRRYVGQGIREQVPAPHGEWNVGSSFFYRQTMSDFAYRTKNLHLEITIWGRDFPVVALPLLPFKAASYAVSSSDETMVEFYIRNYSRRRALIVRPFENGFTRFDCEKGLFIYPDRVRQLDGPQKPRGRPMIPISLDWIKKGQGTEWVLDSSLQPADSDDKADAGVTSEIYFEARYSMPKYRRNTALCFNGLFFEGRQAPVDTPPLTVRRQWGVLPVFYDRD